LGQRRTMKGCLAASVAVALSLVLVPGAGATNISTLSGNVTEYISIPTGVAGICVTLYSTTSTATYAATTDSSGDYSRSVPYGDYDVEFDPTCGGTLTSAYQVGFFAGGGGVDPSIANSEVVSVTSALTQSVDGDLRHASPISGTVTNPGSVGVADVCVYIYSVASGVAYTTPEFAETASDGTYTVDNFGGGFTEILFDPTCSDAQPSPYAMQYYDNEPDLGDATTENFQGNQSYSGIDATLGAGGSISGVVTAPGAANAAGVCVLAFAGADGYFQNLAITEGDGAYQITNLPADSYKIQFDPTCSGLQSTDYTGNWYNDAPSISMATSEAVPAGGAVTGIDGTLTLVAAPVAVTTTALPTAIVGSSYLANLMASGGDGVYLWSASGLPNGLSLNSSSGVISGTPTAATISTVTITVDDVAVPTLSSTVRLEIPAEYAPVLPGASTTTLPSSLVPVTTSSTAPPSTATTLPPLPRTGVVSGTFSIPLSGSAAHLPLSCFATTACSGTVKVSAKMTTSKVELVKVAKRLEKRVVLKTANVLVAEGSYKLAAAHTKSVALYLTVSGRRDAAVLKTQPASGTVTATVKSGITATRKIRIT
jgi:hypothetical protein